MISAVGVTGIAVSWLISRVEDRICGVRYVDLLDSVYPKFFPNYFSIFIPTSLVGILAGNAGLFWPALWAFLGVIGYISLLMLICYLFVIRADQREVIAFKYYQDKLTESENNQSEIQNILLNAADYTHMLMHKEHQNGSCKQLMELWKKGIDHMGKDMICWNAVTNRYWEEEPDSVIQSIQSSRMLWATMLEGETDSYARLEIIVPLLTALRKEQSPGALIPILTGLSQALLDLHTEPVQVVEETAKLIRSLQQADDRLCETDIIPMTLTGSLAISLIVRRMIDSHLADDGLQRMCILLLPQLEQLVSSLYKTEPSLVSLLFLYGEWSARRALHISLSRFLLWVDNLIVDNAVRYCSLFDPNEEGWHLKMLVCLIVSLRNI